MRIDIIAFLFAVIGQHKEVIFLTKTFKLFTVPLLDSTALRLVGLVFLFSLTG